MSLRRFLSLAAVVSLSALAVACDDEEVGSIDGTLRSDGYALFSVENQQQQSNAVTVNVGKVTAGNTYVLLYSTKAPENAGWFQFDPSTRSRCGGDLGDHCKVDGYGYMVDVITVPAGQTDIVLRDKECGCDSNNSSRNWTGHWAVMRIERGDATTPTSPIHFEVTAHDVDDAVAQEPDITQLQ